MNARRRATLTAMLASVVAPWAGAARGPRRVGLLWAGPEEMLRREVLPELTAGLKSLRWERGRNLELDIEVSAGASGLDAAAARLAARDPELIITIGTQSTRALLRAAPRTPIVTNVADPVGSGFAASLVRPGGKVTGLSQAAPEVARKGIETFRALVPFRTLAIVRGDQPGDREFAALLERSASEAGVTPLSVVIPRERATSMVSELPRGTEALYLNVWPDLEGVARLVADAVRARMPMFSNSEATVEHGLLASFNSVAPDYGQRTAAIVDRVLRGDDPATIPFELPRQYRFVVNRATASALGIAIPAELMLRVDRVVG